MKYILIMMFIAYGPNMGNVVAEFNDFKSCEAAYKAIIKPMETTRSSRTLLEGSGCYPKGHTVTETK